MSLYLYGDLVYCTVCGIMRPCRNYPGQPRTWVHNRFNKKMAKLKTRMEYGFTIHQYLWMWNGFYLELKFCCSLLYSISAFVKHSYGRQSNKLSIFLSAARFGGLSSTTRQQRLIKLAPNQRKRVWGTTGQASSVWAAPFTRQFICFIGEG